MPLRCAAHPRLRPGPGPAHRRGRRATGRRRRRRPRTAVVIGAGFVGLETAENLARRGIAVTWWRPPTRSSRRSTPSWPSWWPPSCVGPRRRRRDRGGRHRGDRRRRGPGRRSGHRRRPSWSGPSASAPTSGWPSWPASRSARRRYRRRRQWTGPATPTSTRSVTPWRSTDSVGGGSSLIALANVANRQGRRVADDIGGLPVRPAPRSGTAIVKVFELTAAMTGWNETRLRAAGGASGPSTPIP